MVQRYSYSHGWQEELKAEADGEYVKHEDYVKLEAAVIALLADINRRYPGEGFKCPLILKLAEIVEHEPRN